MRTITFTIPGKAVPVRRERAAGAAWLDLVRHQCRLATRHSPMIIGPVKVSILVVVERPNFQTSQYPSRWSALDYADTVLDAIETVAFESSSQVVRCVVEKKFSDAPSLTAVCVETVE